MGRTAPLTSERCILYIYSINIGTEYFKHALYSPFFSLQNAVWFLYYSCFIYRCAKIKKNNCGTKGLNGAISNELILMMILSSVA
jgi:hypothetical protein